MKICSVPRILPRGGPTDPDDLLDSLDEGQAVNRAVLSGLIAEEPQRDKSRDGGPITVLLLSFTPPDRQTTGQRGSACCEIEILDEIADRHRQRLQAGERIRVVGQLTGDGLWANSIGPWKPVEATAE